MPPPGNWNRDQRREAVTAIAAAIIGSPYATKRVEQDYENYKLENPGETRTLGEHIAIIAWLSVEQLIAAEP